MNDLELLKEQGYLVIRDALPADAFDELTRELGEVIDKTARQLFAAGYLEELCEGEPFARRLACLSSSARAKRPLWRGVQGKHHKTAGLFKVITHPTLLDRVATLVGDEILAHPQFNIRAILPDQQENKAPWHQDLAYLDERATKTFTVNFWIPLQDTPEEMGPLQVIEGSNHHGLFTHLPAPNGYFGIPEEELPPGRRVVCEVPRGGALVMLPTTVHRALMNRTSSVRWSLDIRYCDRHSPTGWDIPGFVCRSLTHPEAAARSHEDWLSVMLTRGSVEGAEPAERGIQDCVPVGEAGEGVPVYLHMYVDSYSRMAFAELGLSDDDESCAAFFAERVQPLFDSLGLRVRQVVTRPTRGLDAGSAFHRALEERGVEHALTDPIAHEQNLMCAEFSATLRDELGFKVGEVSGDELPALRGSLEERVRHYNNVRPHKRRGRPPYVAVTHALRPPDERMPSETGATEVGRTLEDRR